MQALIMKAKDVGAITPRKCQSLFIQLSASGQRKNERVQIQGEQPQTLQKLLAFHKDNLSYSPANLRKLLLCADENQFDCRFNSSERHLRVIG